MSLKTTKIIYRVSTIALALFILPGLFFMNSEMAVEGMKSVGLTEAVRLQQLLGRASPVAILAIILGNFLPQLITPRLKERAYAGLSFIYLGAFVAHMFIDGLMNPMSYTPLVAFAIVMISYTMWHKMLKIKGENVN